MSYTNPDREEDRNEDLLFSMLVFSRAMSLIFKPGEGLLVDLKGDMCDLHPNSTKVIVFHDGDMIKIMDASERTDLKEGDWIQMIDNDNLKN